MSTLQKSRFTDSTGQKLQNNGIRRRVFGLSNKKKISPVYSPANLNKHDSELIKVQSIDKVDLKEMESDYQGSPLMRP